MVWQNSILFSSFLVCPFIPACYAHLGPNPFKPNLIHGVDVSPFISALGLLIYTSSYPTLTMQFRRHCLHGSASSNYTSPLISLAWTKSWVYPVPHACRNVSYRLLHCNIPHRSLLNRLILSYFSIYVPFAPFPRIFWSIFSMASKKKGSSGKLFGMNIFAFWLWRQTNYKRLFPSGISSTYLVSSVCFPSCHGWICFADYMACKLLVDFQQSTFCSICCSSKFPQAHTLAFSRSLPYLRSRSPCLAPISIEFV